MTDRAFNDGQVWENDNILLQVNVIDGGYLVAAFKREGCSVVYSDAVIFSDEKSMVRHMEKNGMKPTGKVITLCKRET